MSEQAPESQGLNPAWQPFLDKLPEELHPIVMEDLQTWDRTMQEKVQGLQEQYAPLKPLIEQQVDLNAVQQALLIANHLQSNPEDFVRNAIANFGIQLDTGNDNDEYEEEPMYNGDEDDISNHPAFKALTEKLEQVTGFVQQQTEREQQSQQEQQLEELFAAKQEERGEFDRLYVSALMANGVDVDQAIQTYHDTINSAVAAKVQTQQPPAVAPPVVMGGAGTAGSGNPAEPIKMGALTNGQVTDLAIQYYQNLQQNQ